jgi:carboxypeptidase C (cathepsin A)
MIILLDEDHIIFTFTVKKLPMQRKALFMLMIMVTVFSMLSNTAIAENETKLSSVRYERKLAIDDKNITKHSTKVNGNKFDYTATTGTQPVWDEEGNPTASLFYTYYRRTDVKDAAKRPLVISFNGGPGSASVWMHVAYTGPQVLNVDKEGYPLQPYGVKTNPYSILDVADIVFVNPVNTGYSRILPGKDGNMPTKAQQKKMFFGVNADVKYLAEWINTFVSRNNRWRSPKYLIGESYGTTRVSGLAKELQSRQWMYINGVILVSPTDIGIKRDGPVKAANRLPYFAAAAWYHKALTPELQSKPLKKLLKEVEQYTISEYLPALAMGGFITEREKKATAEQVARYSGLTVNAVLNNNLDVNNAFFWKELLRDRKQTIGRLDSRYLGIDKKVAGSRPDYNAELSSWLHSFTPAINYYLREKLDYKTDIKYNMFGNVHPWDRTGNHTGEGLRSAMAENPYLKVMIQSGYYDGATNYFDAKYTMWQLDPSGMMKERLSFKGYESGHMMYLRHDDLRDANQDIRDFIIQSLPAKDEAAKY